MLRTKSLNLDRALEATAITPWSCLNFLDTSLVLLLLLLVLLFEGIFIDFTNHLLHKGHEPFWLWHFWGIYGKLGCNVQVCSTL